MPGDNHNRDISIRYSSLSVFVEAVHQGLAFPVKYRMSLTGHPSFQAHPRHQNASVNKADKQP